jgi:inner membrane protein YidH
MSAPAAHPQHASEHLANERTHLAYLRTSFSLISLGITVNRFSLYLMQQDAMPSTSRRGHLLAGTEQVGLGMVLFGFAVMSLALYRYHTVEKEIDRDDYRPNRKMVELITLAALVGGAVSIVWLFRR